MVKARLGNQGGFSFLEIVIALGIIMILVAALVPTVSSKLEDAKIARARDDVQLIAASIASFYNNVGVWPMYDDGTDTTSNHELKYLKSSDGDDPDTSCGSDWHLTSDNDTLENQLVYNQPNGQNKPYPDWRGPYQNVSEDPWGKKYIVNVEHLLTTGTDKKVVVVISAGPDGELDTGNNEAPEDFSVEDDDIACVIR